MSDSKQLVIAELARYLDIPESAYLKAEARYADLGQWFSRKEAHCANFDPHIYPQGSFRLGTVIRADEYDLDFGCRLRKGVSKSTHSQEQLKNLVGIDLEEYRHARQIEHPLEEKNRCWRVRYQDELPFHMDGVPSIPEEQHLKTLLRESMVKLGANTFLAQAVAEHAGSITDMRLQNYKQISPGWRISNSEGYAKWFESRMKLAAPLMEKHAFEARAATVDELPARKWKSPLQRGIQILKSHRDRMFEDNCDAKPISIIITTLAAGAYQGEQNIADALEGILLRMGGLVRSSKPRVPNPVNSVEDFADKWYDPEYAHLHLEYHFKSWLKQAQADFNIISQSRDPEQITEQARTKFGASLSVGALRSKLAAGAPTVITTSKTHTINETPAKPWSRK